MAFALILAGAAQGDAVIDGDVVAYLCRFAHHNACTVVNEKPFTYGGTGVYLNTSEPPPPLADSTRQKKAPVAEQPVGNAVENKRMEPRVQQHHFRKAAGCGVFFQHAFCI